MKQTPWGRKSREKKIAHTENSRKLTQKNGKTSWRAQNLWHTARTDCIERVTGRTKDREQLWAKRQPWQSATREKSPCTWACRTHEKKAGVPRIHGSQQEHEETKERQAKRETERRSTCCAMANSAGIPENAGFSARRRTPWACPMQAKAENASLGLHGTVSCCWQRRKPLGWRQNPAKHVGNAFPFKEGNVGNRATQGHQAKKNWPPT